MNSVDNYIDRKVKQYPNAAFICFIAACFCIGFFGVWVLVG